MPDDFTAKLLRSCWSSKRKAWRAWKATSRPTVLPSLLLKEHGLFAEHETTAELLLGAKSDREMDNGPCPSLGRARIER